MTAVDPQADSNPGPIRYDDGPFPRARIGFVCVANAGITEGDMMRMRPEGVGLSFTRVPMGTACTIENLAAMEHELELALSGFMPARNDLDVICYNCTSGSFVVGEEVIRRKIENRATKVLGTTLLTGVVQALRCLGITRVSLATAYTDDINKLEHDYFERAGFAIPRVSGLGLTTDMEMNKVSPDYLREFAISLDCPDAEAIFLSCGALRSLDILEEVEGVVGKPVICSNQASFWHCLRLVGIHDRLAGFGRLFSDA
jgi:maleate isomerase